MNDDDEVLRAYLSEQVKLQLLRDAIDALDSALAFGWDDRTRYHFQSSLTQLSLEDSMRMYALARKIRNLPSGRENP